MANTTETSLVLKWNALACDAINYTGTPITLAARALAMVHTAMYDAWTAYSDGGEASTTTGALLKRPESEWTYQNREKAFSYAAYRVLYELFEEKLPEEHKKMFDLLMKELKYRVTDTTKDVTKPQGIGNLSAALILECRAGDLSNIDSDYADYTGYEPVNPPPGERVKYLDRWQPQLIEPGKTPQEFLTPHWGLVKPFALKYGGQFRPDPPISCESSKFKKQLEAIINISACLDDEQKMIAEYWAGMHEDRHGDELEDMEDENSMTMSVGLPVLCCTIGRYVANKNGFMNSNCIKMFFALTNAIFDTTIAVWDSKRHYDYCRPVSAIHEMLDDEMFEAWGRPCGGTVPMQGENWCPYLISTPPYAEYISTSSALTRAMAEIITCFCGNNEYGDCVIFEPSSSKIEPDCTPSESVTLNWETLHDAADQAGMAHRFGGINFEDGDEKGRELGKKVAVCVWDKVRYYLDGIPC